MRRRPIRDHAFFKQPVFEKRLGQRFFQLPELSADILHLVRGGVAGGIAGKPLLARLEEVLRPAIIDVLVQPLAATQFRNRVLAAQAFKNDPDLLF